MLKGMLSATAVVATLATMPAGAACTQANATGTWKLYDANADSSGVGWVKCTLYVAAGGAINKSSSCSNSAGQGSPVTGQVSLTSGPNCLYNGYVTYTLNGQSSSVNEAAMAQNHQTVSGVGTFSGGAFVFTMVKIK